MSGFLGAMALELDELASLVHEREAMLHGSREGVVHSRHPEIEERV